MAVVNGGNVTVGKGVSLGRNVIAVSHDSIRIGDRCSVGPNRCFTAMTIASISGEPSSVQEPLRRARFRPIPWLRREETCPLCPFGMMRPGEGGTAAADADRAPFFGSA